MRAFIDFDVLIWHLRGERKALELPKRLCEKEKIQLWTGAMQRAEVVFFMRPKEECATMLFLSEYRTAPVDQRVVDKAGELYRQWNPRYGTDVSDTILAATALQNGGCIYTLNTKHYPMPEVTVKRAWRMTA